MSLTTFKTFLTSAVLSLFLLSAVSCGGEHVDPITAEKQKWSFDEDASQDEKDEAYRKVEEKKEYTEDILDLNNRSRRPSKAVREQCEKNLSDLAEAKSKLKEAGANTGEKDDEKKEEVR